MACVGMGRGVGTGFDVCRLCARPIMDISHMLPHLTHTAVLLYVRSIQVILLQVKKVRLQKLRNLLKVTQLAKLTFKRNFDFEICEVFFP